jgi:hypothetical protein
MQQPTEPLVTVPQSAIQALAQALQNHLTATQNARAALNIIPQLDQQLVSGWSTFDKACKPVEQKPADDKPTDPA